MNLMTFRRDELVARITKNRDEHRDLFLKAQEGYRQRVVEELDAMLEAARRGDPIRTVVRLDAPEDHTAEYDRVLDMLAMSAKEEVEMDFSTFAQVVRNEWAWFGAASVKNTTYASGGRVAR